MFILFNTVFFTLLLFCAYMALAQWRLSKDDAVPWYVGYLAATFLHYGRQFWVDVSGMPGVPGVPDPPLEWDTPLSYAAFACYFLFVARMLELGAAAPRLNRVLVYLARFLGLMSGGHLVVQMAFGRTAADAAHQLFQVLLLPVLVWLVVRALHHAGLFYQKLVLAGTAALVLGFLFVVAKRRWTDEFFLVPEMICCFPTGWGAFCLYHLKVGVVLDVLCFSWALALRQRALFQVVLPAPALPARAERSPPVVLPGVGTAAGIAPPESPAPDVPPSEAQALEPQPSDDVAEKLAAYLAQHYQNAELTIGQIARGLGIGTTQLNRRLKRVTGLTTEQFFLCYRLERARERLLADREKSVGVIVAEVGLKDLAHFSRAFRKRYGCSPSEMRGKNAF